MGKNLKRFFAMFLCLIIPVILCSCDKDHKEHTYSTEWTSDDSHHWNKCTYDGCEEQGNKAEHTYDSGVDSGHYTVYTCSVCGHKKEIIKEHIVDNSAWQKDETSHWHKCTYDGCEEQLDKVAHTWNEGTVSGHQTIYTCTVCGQTKQEERDCIAGSEWVSDENSHWHNCTIEGCDKHVDQANHTWGEPRSEGHNYVYECEVCHRTKSEVKPCIFDSSSWEYDETNHWQKCTIDGCDKTTERKPHSFNENGVISGHYTVYTCTVCAGTKEVRNDCEASTTWSKDNSYHRHICTISGCTEILDKAEHSWDNGNESENGKLIFTCTECGATREECGDCSYSDDWSSDEAYHWHACVTPNCTGRSDKSKHLWSNPVIINHKNHYTCEVCGYEKDEELPCDFTNAPWVYDETNHWHVCTIEGCDKIDRKVPHIFGAPTLDGHTNVFECDCGYEKREKAPCDYKNSEWKHDETNHWHECTIAGCTETTKIGDKAEHTFDSGVVEGHDTVYTCIVCGETKTVYTGHIYGEEWESDATNHWHKCIVEGCNEISDLGEHRYGNPVVAEHQNIYTCADCEHKKVEYIEHNYVWTGNDQSHWLKCSVEGCTETKDYAFHTWSTDPVLKDHGKVYTCEVCGREKFELLDCIYSDEWTSDETSHWHACIITGCTNKKDVAEHRFGDLVQSGDMTAEICSQCGYSKETWQNIYIRAYEQFANNPYKIVLKDFKLRINEYKDIDFAELYLNLNDLDNIIGYGYCKITEPDKNKTLTNLIAYVAGDTLYIVEGEDGNETIVVSTIGNFMSFIDLSFNNVIQGGLSSVINTMKQMKTTFNEEITKVVSYFENLYSRELANSKLELVMNKLYNVQKVDKTYVYTFNYDVLRELNTYLNTNTLADFIDKVGGEGKFDEIVKFLNNHIEFTLAQWIELGNENGFDIYEVLAYADTLAQKFYDMMTSSETAQLSDTQGDGSQQKMTIEKLISSMTGAEIPDIEGILQDEKNQNKTVVDLINLIIDLINQKNSESETPTKPIEHVTAGKLKALISYVETDYCKGKSLYELGYIVYSYVRGNIPQGESATNLEIPNLYKIVDDYITMFENFAGLVLTTGNDGTILSYKISLKADVINGTIELLQSSEIVKSQEILAKVDEIMEMGNAIISTPITKNALSSLNEDETFVRTENVDSSTGETTITFTNIVNNNYSYGYNQNYVYKFVFGRNGALTTYSYSLYSEYLDKDKNVSSFNRKEGTFVFGENVIFQFEHICGDYVLITLIDSSNIGISASKNSIYYTQVDLRYVYNLKTNKLVSILNNDLGGEYHYCDLQEKVEDRLFTDYGMLLHFVCSECGKDRYQQVSKFIDEYYEVDIRDAYTNYSENVKEDEKVYDLSDLYIYYDSLNVFYVYDANTDKFVMDGSILFENTELFKDINGSYSFRILKKNAEAAA